MMNEMFWMDVLEMTTSVKRCLDEVVQVDTTWSFDAIALPATPSSEEDRVRESDANISRKPDLR